MDRLSLFNTFKWVCDKVLTDYKWLIAIFFVLRLYGITDPPLEIQHNWRQCTGLMIARNFLVTSPNILYPRLDDLCSSSDIIAFEFQLLNYLHYLISLIFGYDHWYGRLINLFISSAGVFSFGYLILKLFNSKIAWFSVLSLLVSNWFIFSRKMMPDTFSISLVFISFYFALMYFKNTKWQNIILFFIFFTLGGLSKIPAIIYSALIICLYIMYRHKAILYLGLCTILSLFIVYIWYFVWGPFVSMKYGNWTNLGKPILTGFQDIVSNPLATLYNITFNSFLSYMLFSLFIFGLTVLIKKKERVLIFSLSLIFILFVLYIFKAGFFFYHHNYYMIPIVPLFAFIIGYGLNDTKNKFILLIFFAGVLESIANQQHDFRIKPSELYKLELESKLDSIEKGGPKSPILINTESNPQQIYLANRKGCYITITEMADINKINSFKSLGYRWLVIDKTYGYSSVNLSIIYADNNYIIYRL
jgi:hypothetical protein